jgi:hypothetical protein
MPAAVDSYLGLILSPSLAFHHPISSHSASSFSFPTRLNPSSPKTYLLGIMQTPLLHFKLTFICIAKDRFLVSFAQFSSDLLDIYNFTVRIEAESLLRKRGLDRVRRVEDFIQFFEL